MEAQTVKDWEQSRLGEFFDFTDALLSFDGFEEAFSGRLFAAHFRCDEAVLVIDGIRDDPYKQLAT